MFYLTLTLSSQKNLFLKELMEGSSFFIIIIIILMLGHGRFLLQSKQTNKWEHELFRQDYMQIE